MKINNLIIGGGITGLYLAYKSNINNTVIVEKSYRLGGRIHTYDKQNMKYDTGAGRLSSNQKLIMKLISELKLDNDLIKIDKKKHYFLNNKYYKNEKELFNDYNVKNYSGIDKLWKYVLNHKKSNDEKYLQNINLIAHLHNILDSHEVDLLLDTFGYISETVELNAYNAILTLKRDFDVEKNDFYFLLNGLSQVVNKLEIILQERGVKILKGYYLKDFNNITKNAIIVSDDLTENNYKYKNIFFTICRKDYFNIPFFRKKKYMNVLNSVTEGRLMRIFAKYPLNKNGKAWFNNLPKLITDNPILFVIPMNPDSGLIQISYSDSYFAEYWNNMNTEEEIIENLNKYLNKIYPDKKIPNPEFITLHYWPSGVHYWKPKFNSLNIRDQINEIFNKDNIYILGETYSNNQAWIEGALDTVENYLKKNVQKAGSKYYSIEEVRKHNTVDSLWTIIREKKYEGEYFVYDLTNWINDHPGGKFNIMKIGGKDGTDLFFGNVAHAGKAVEVLKKFKIGVLDKK